MWDPCSTVLSTRRGWAARAGYTRWRRKRCCTARVRHAYRSLAVVSDPAGSHTVHTDVPIGDPPIAAWIAAHGCSHGSGPVGIPLGRNRQELGLGTVTYSALPAGLTGACVRELELTRVTHDVPCRPVPTVPPSNIRTLVVADAPMPSRGAVSAIVLAGGRRRPRPHIRHRSMLH